MEATFSACLSVQLISTRFTCLPTFRTTGLPVRCPNTRPVRSLRHQLNKTTAKKKQNTTHDLSCCCAESRERQFHASRWSVNEASDSKMVRPAVLVANTSNSAMLNSSSKPPRACESLWGKSVEVRAACSTVSSLCLFVLAGRAEAHRRSELPQL